MLKRYYLADIIGDGTDDGGDFRAAVADYPLGVSGSMPWDEVNNRPANDWMLVEVFQGDVSMMVGDARIDALPDCSLDTPVAQIDAAQLASMQAALARRGIGITIEYAGSFGDVLAAIEQRANLRQ